MVAYSLFHTRSALSTKQRHTNKCVMEYLREAQAYLKKILFSSIDEVKRFGTESTNATILHDKRNSNE